MWSRERQSLWLSSVNEYKLSAFYREYIIKIYIYSLNFSFPSSLLHLVESASTMLRGVLEILALLVITFAWVIGQLDPLQKRLQEMLLDTMGETKVSYGLKSDCLPHRSLAV